jgi:hypothetical protein
MAFCARESAVAAPALPAQSMTLRIRVTAKSAKPSVRKHGLQK